MFQHFKIVKSVYFLEIFLFHIFVGCNLQTTQVWARHHAKNSAPPATTGTWNTITYPWPTTAPVIWTVQIQIRHVRKSFAVNARNCLTASSGKILKTMTLESVRSGNVWPRQHVKGSCWWGMIRMSVIRRAVFCCLRIVRGMGLRICLLQHQRRIRNNTVNNHCEMRSKTDFCLKRKENEFFHCH